MVPYMLHLAQKSIKRDVNKLLYVNKTAWRKKKQTNKQNNLQEEKQPITEQWYCQVILPFGDKI